MTDQDHEAAREDWEERAAILEYDAGHPRHFAERVASELTGYWPEPSGTTNG